MGMCTVYRIYGSVAGGVHRLLDLLAKRLDYLFDFGIIIIRRAQNACQWNDCVRV